MNLKLNFASWRTTLGGISALITAIVAKAGELWGLDPAIVSALNSLAVAITGFAMLFARDHAVTSEQAGATDHTKAK